MADLGIARQTTAFYRSSTGARRQTARWITHTHLARRQHNSQAARASRDPECTPSPFQSAASPAAQDIGRKEHLSEPSAVSQQTVQQSAHSHRPLPAAALFAALRVTHAFRIIAHVTTHLVLDIRHGLFRKAQQTQQGLTQAQQTIQQAVEQAAPQPAQTISQAEAELTAAWARLQQHAVAGGEALMKMLHSLDKPSITLDKKWADMQEQLAGNKDVSDRLQTLFTSSMESTKTVAAMLAQSGGSLQQSYWTSPQTQQVIEQEEELRLHKCWVPQADELMGHFTEAANFIPVVACSESEFLQDFLIVSVDLQQQLLREAKQQEVLAYV
ncbi:TPA: hypothetical protein ACH3X2_014173 [Trebouxia sp. C0005]